MWHILTNSTEQKVAMLLAIFCLVLLAIIEFVNPYPQSGFIRIIESTLVSCFSGSVAYLFLKFWISVKNL